MKLALIFWILLLSGCGTISDKNDPLGSETYEPVGKNGLTIQDYVDMDKQRAQYALQVQEKLGILKNEPDVQVETTTNPLTHPTVSVKYSGTPPKGIFEDMDEQLRTYKASIIDGETIVYSTDLAQMTMILERYEDGKPYDYRELTTVVPYGYCLDFIEQNLGKQADNYILRKVVCSQDDLGLDY